MSKIQIGISPVNSGGLLHFISREDDHVFDKTLCGVYVYRVWHDVWFDLEEMDKALKLLRDKGGCKNCLKSRYVGAYIKAMDRCKTWVKVG